MATVALPDAYDLPLHGVLAAEDAAVGSMLGNFDLLDHLTEGGTVPGSVLPCDSHLFCALALKKSDDDRE